MNDAPVRTAAAGRAGRRRPILLVLPVLVVLALVAGLVLGARALFGGSAAPDYPGGGTGSAVVQVHQGDTAAAIGATMTSKDVVRSTGAFVAVADADPRSRSIQPGYYALRRQMRASAALNLLLDPSSRLLGRVRVPEGATVAQVLAAVAAGTQLPAAQLRQAAAAPGSLGLPAYAKGRLEGFLYPATYDVPPGTSAPDVLRMMVSRYKQQAVTLDLEARAKALGRTPYEVLTTASLVEKETAYPGDRAQVAEVVYNRLKADMPLQFDSTVNYVRTEKKLRLSLEDIKVDSAYNTYRVKGLPPTPIGSPGEASLQAALAPATGPDVYFVAVDKSGRSLFTSDYDTFLRAKAKAQADGVY